MLSVKAKYKNGKIVFKKKIPISGPKDVIVTFLDNDEGEERELTPAGEELLERKKMAESGEAQFLSEDDFFEDV
jgi:hypothetical protein